MEHEEDWDEEQLVIVELDGLLEQEVLSKATTEHCRLLGIDTDEPVLQIGPYTFVGHYEDVIGTHCIFEETFNNNNEKKFQFKAKTNKCLKMGRAFLRDKSQEIVGKNSDESSSSDSSSNDGNDSDDDKDGVNNQQDDTLSNSCQGNVSNIQQISKKTNNQQVGNHSNTEDDSSTFISQQDSSSQQDCNHSNNQEKSMEVD
ncbi:general transcription factor 3C polypeptide 6 isoform X2 [Exaiptasia diaphana]|uniref:Transcription factor TFIIIC triple barrel domain-containing protein n=1 Tax=Exaiptasia diaphana TaxID=2652724 RepID=A0A913X152_EXADI|nr:general transcription factor 3C polypeptide 6 isoform X2 [Exaiptasia diaphana]KXJ16241.1 General transcription factor 3C polypeptide 6 [Exaiptasia diaphana]